VARLSLWKEQNNVTCEIIQSRLSAYVDGELPAPHAAHVAEHLARCPQCRAAHERLEALAAVLHGAAVPAVPAALSARVLAAGQAVLARRSLRLFRVLPWLADLNNLPGYMKAAASVVLLIGLGTGAFLGMKVSTPSAPLSVAQTTSDSDPAVVLGFDFFADAPQGSLSQSYLELAAGGRAGER
jgi:anti-sigma factor RsiW